MAAITVPNAAPEGVTTTAIVTSDTAVKAAPGKVYWISASAAATGGAWQINDSTDDSGTDKISAVQPALSTTPILFDPPLECTVGIFADIPGSNITLTIGYA